MSTRTATTMVRADVVGSLLRPEYLREARDAARAGTIDADELHAAEDRAVLEAIALQESAGIEAITDGEYRRNGWIAFIPMVDDPLFRRARQRLRVPRRGLRLARPLEDGRRRAGRHVGAAAARSRSSRGRLEVDRDIVGGRVLVPEGERAARARSTRSRRRAGTGSTGTPSTRADAYPTSDDFIRDIARLTREHIVDRLVELGCDYIQLDAPNYAQWHIDPGNRAAFEEHGHDMAHELVADAEFDSMVFEGLTGVTRAMHMCRGNAPGGMWAASGRLRGDLEARSSRA